MHVEKTFKPVEILLVEDSAGDVALTKLALRDSKISNNINVVSDGVEAMAYLRRQGPYESSVKPDLILLDVNMPRKTGLEVLAELRADKSLCLTPVVILTTSQAEQDVVRSYLLHANCYVVKPVDLDKFIDIVKSIENFWFSIVTLPSVSGVAILN